MINNFVSIFFLIYFALSIFAFLSYFVYFILLLVELEEIKSRKEAIIEKHQIY